MSVPRLPVTDEEASMLILASAPGRSLLMPWGSVSGLFLYVQDNQLWALRELLCLRGMDRAKADTVTVEDIALALQRMAAKS